MSSPFVWHGGALEAAKRAFGGDAPWMDLSTGINPDPWPGAAPDSFDWARLPEMSALKELEQVAAAYFGVAPVHVCAVPGTEIGMRLVGRMLGGPAHHVEPGYRTHAEMIAGSIPTAAHDASGTSITLILANPNNPDGRTIAPAEMDGLLRKRSDTSWLLIDEAFADVDPRISMASDVRDAARLVIFRSFGKFFGLAGVRLGFVLGPQIIIDPLRSLLGAWPLSAAALAIGTAAYQDHAWIARTRLGLFDAVAALDALLTDHGYSPIGACPLFRLIEVDDAHALFDQLARQAILTRPFADRRHWLRIGLPRDAASFDRLDRALRHG
ncbi:MULTISPECIES: aminotransferase class I/II-fold pyridoxal phosphate-dependent enzyme [Sphingobium]|jgi:cobalamin biosynthesis protein CobC|uniref:aminotransferase class I/II-fold pyridoxal phosphate-dependent enzyme n=1 Tax=Sphingobium TaxID=165695 RepID=UPI000C410844|nr:MULTISPECIES: aminotransferase class I/II-fold pyridoxal phosphate-dependent enzyme [Sphingobium]MBS47335.1 threonine-phosphate decarboxylase [Sphingobium sp.]MCC4257905.1 aminotransferase class I/II-fold pyridoxal phosphate-dependent enzyme [Sphingobium lactosutens]HCW60975.1 threonine-phosphate decarboxylase [Sphingobium sp.]|tara:strand:+ start:1649 stop:2626 length:978 start_codon:yes stop_codon:yes gene_type:complete